MSGHACCLRRSGLTARMCWREIVEVQSEKTEEHCNSWSVEQPSPLEVFYQHGEVRSRESKKNTYGIGMLCSKPPSNGSDDNCEVDTSIWYRSAMQLHRIPENPTSQHNSSSAPIIRQQLGKSKSRKLSVASALPSSSEKSPFRILD